LSATSAASLRATSNIGRLLGGLLKCKENITFFTTHPFIFITHPSIFITHPSIFTTHPLPVYVRKTVVRHRIPPEQRPLAPASSAYAVRHGRKRVEVERGGRGEREGRGLRGLRHLRL
jgi:hypothetical protein